MEPGGNPLGVVLDGAAVPPAERQAGAADIGFSETVFVDDRASGAVQIFTPAVEMPFAGHPAGGDGLVAGARGHTRDPAQPTGGAGGHPGEGRLRVRDRQAGMGAAVRVGGAGVPRGGGRRSTGRPATATSWVPTHGEDAATVRARVFPLRLGIEEDEATGAAAVRLGALVGRPFTIHQGRGSEIEVLPGADGTVEIGGRVVLDEVRPYPSAG